jgi:16S rRNA (guanine966-N2)-methyltransferase
LNVSDLLPELNSTNSKQTYGSNFYRNHYTRLCVWERERERTRTRRSGRSSQNQRILPRVTLQMPRIEFESIDTSIKRQGKRRRNLNELPLSIHVAPNTTLSFEAADRLMRKIFILSLFTISVMKVAAWTALPTSITKSRVLRLQSNRNTVQLQLQQQYRFLNTGEGARTSYGALFSQLSSPNDSPASSVQPSLLPELQRSDDNDIHVPCSNNNVSNNNTFTSTSTSTSTSTMIPANLRRKIQAKRPTLGHVVPLHQKQRQRITTTSSTTGGSLPSQLQFQGRRTSTTTTSSNLHSNPSFIHIMAGVSRGRKLQSPATVYLRPMMGKVKEAIYSTLTYMGVYDSQSSSSRGSSTTRQIRHLDLFAGSGSVGLESLSRGATHCTFVDFSPDCCSCIQRNIDMTGLGSVMSNGRNANVNMDGSGGLDKSSLVCCADAMFALTNPHSIGIPMESKYQIVTICPPYEEVVYGDLLEAVVGSDIVTEDTIVVLEYPIELVQSSSLNKKQKSPKVTTSYSSSNNQNLPHVIQCKSNTAIGIRNRKYGRTVIAMYIINPTGRFPDANSRPEEFVNPA